MRAKLQPTKFIIRRSRILIKVVNKLDILEEIRTKKHINSKHRNIYTGYSLVGKPLQSST